MRRGLLGLAGLAFASSLSAQVRFEPRELEQPRPCYEQSSHVKLVHLAFDVLPPGPLRDELAANGERFLGPEAGFSCGGTNDDGESIAEGDHEEDCQLRFLRHFWDSDTDAGFAGQQDARDYAEGIYRDAVALYVGGDKASAWYQLGRVTHLLQDLCNASHCHLDPHGAADPDNNYEALTAQLFDDLLDDGELDGLVPLDPFTLAPTPCPPIFADSPKQAQPLFRLFLHVAETTDFFESGDVVGDGDCVGGGESAASFGARIGHAVGMDPPASGAFTAEHLETHADVVLPLAIASCAGLWELFWADTHEDADGDGQLDGVDPCPDEAIDDEDGDGICAGARYLEPKSGAGDDCPKDATRVAPGACGCSRPETDSDGDGIADCNDLCPTNANPGQEDSDGDGIGDACLFRFRLADAFSAGGAEQLDLALTGALDAGCLSAAELRVSFDHSRVGFVAALDGADCEVDAGLTADGVVDLAVGCDPGADGEVELATLRFLVPAAEGQLALFTVELSQEAATDCNGASVAALGRAGVLSVSCLAGDVDEDGDVDLGDLLASRATDGMDCSDLSPDTRGCDPLVGEGSSCPTGDDVFDDADRELLRAVVAGILRAACEDCDSLATPALLRLLGDVAPADGGDALLDIADVLRVLRFVVALELAVGEDALRGDINQDGFIDVQDVLILLRVVVGLAELDWPERELKLAIDQARTLSAWSLRVSGWPPFARPSSFDADDCPGAPFGGLDAAGDAAAITCAPMTPASLSGDIATLRYRSPEAVPASSLTVEASALNAGGAPVAGFSVSASP